MIVPRSGPVRLIGIGLCLLLAWLVVRNAALDMLADRDPALALRLFPAGSKALAADGWSRVAASGGEVDRPARQLAANALRREPVNASAIALSGLAASADGDLDRARLLMEAARDRDPRLPGARYWLLDHDMRSGDYPAGLNEIGPALRLRPGTGDAIMALVMGLLDVPGGMQAVRAKLATDPFWRATFFQTQAYGPGHARPLLALWRALPPPHDRESDEVEQRTVLSAAVLDGDYADAYRLWLSRTPGAGRQPGGPIYDPAFQGLPGTPPFNWSLAQNSDASATMQRTADFPEGSALALSFQGTAPAVLAEQYVLTDAGRYRFQFRARRLGNGGAALLSAQLRCARTDTALASLSAPAGVAGIQSHQAEFDIPPSCPVVRVQFIGEPNEVPGIMQMQVAGVRLIRT